MGRLVVLDQGQLSPRGKYLQAETLWLVVGHSRQVCTEHGLRPALEPLLAGQSSNLSMVERNLSDQDILALLPLIDACQEYFHLF